MHPDARLHRLAARQHGLVTAVQAKRLGFTNTQIRGRVERGELERVSRMVIRSTGAPSSTDQRILAAVWSSGPTAHASRRTAAWLHSFDGFRRPGERPDVVVERPATGHRGLAMVHQTLLLPRRDRTTVRGIPVTSVARTLADLGACVAPSRVEEAADGALRDGIVSIESLRRTLFELWRPGPTGLSTLARTLGADGAHPESWLERRSLEVFDRAGLPAPTLQAVHHAVGHTFRLDFSFADGQVVVEVSGHRTHSTRRQRQADAERRNRLLLQGVAIWEFTYEDVIERPAWVTDTIWAALALITAAG